MDERLLAFSERLTSAEDGPTSAGAPTPSVALRLERLRAAIEREFRECAECEGFSFRETGQLHKIGDGRECFRVQFDPEDGWPPTAIDSALTWVTSGTVKELVEILASYKLSVLHKLELPSSVFYAGHGGPVRVICDYHWNRDTYLFRLDVLGEKSRVEMQ